MKRIVNRILVILICLAGCISPSLAQVWIEGTTQPAARITISSPVEEIVESVAVQEGDIVEKGGTLATLFSTKEQLEVKRLGILIEKALADAKTARDLYDKKIQKKSELLQKEVELKRLKIEQEMAQVSVKQRTIKAPVKGTVVYRLKDPGEAVERVEPVFEIIDASKMKLVFFLSTKHLPNLKKGMKSDVLFPELPEIKERKATLVFIDPQLDSRSGLFRVRFDFDNRELKIKPGVRVKVKLPGMEERE
jgi:RND family efflux transporter MFP subunit